MVRIDEICTLNMGQSPESSSYNEKCEGLPFFQGNADFGEVNPNIRLWCKAPTKVANIGDILISVRAPIGALNIANVQCCIGRGLAALTVNEGRCLKRYFWYAISSKVDELISKGTGSTFKAISKGVLAETELRLPNKKEQAIIAAILDKTAALISARKCQLIKLDNLVKSRFIEMFGDPVENPMGWEVKPLCETTIIITGNTPPRNAKENYGNFIEWIKTDNISDDIYLEKAQEYLSETGYKKGRFVEKDSILMACIAGSIKSIGRVAITDRKVCFNQQINAVTPREYNTFFLYVLFNETQSYIQSTINMSLKGILSKGKMKTLEFIVPPLALQTQFAAFVHQVDKSKFVFLLKQY